MKRKIYDQLLLWKNKRKGIEGTEFLIHYTYGSLDLLGKYLIISTDRKAFHFKREATKFKIWLWIFNHLRKTTYLLVDEKFCLFSTKSR